MSPLIDTRWAFFFPFERYVAVLGSMREVGDSVLRIARHISQLHAPYR